MALQKQVVPVTLSGGLDTKTDPKQVQPGKLLVSENVIMPTGGELSKVDGTTTLPVLVQGGGSFNSGKQLSTIGNEICLSTTEGLYSYSPNLGFWNRKGNLSSCVVNVDPVASGVKDLTSPLVAVVNNIAVYVWVDPANSNSVGNVVFTTVDLQTGAVIQPPSPIANSLGSPRVTVVGQLVYISWLTNSANLWYATINSLTGLLSVQYPLTSPGGSCANYDIAPFNGGMCVVYRETSSSILYVGLWNSVGVPIIPFQTTGINVGTVATDNYICLYPGDQSTTLGMLYGQGSSLNNLVFNNTAFGIYKSPVTVFTSTGGGYSRFSAVVVGNTVEIYYSASGNGDMVTSSVFKRVLNLATNTLSSAVALTSGVTSTSKCFRNDGVTLLCVGYEAITLQGSPANGIDGYQTTSFVIDSAGVMQAVILPGKFGKLSNQFTSPVAFGSQKMLIPVLQKASVISEGGMLFTLDRVSVTTLDFTPSLFAPGQVLGDNLYLAGGFLKQYDGVGVTEASFALWPDPLSQNPTITTTGSIDTGTYLYRAVYEWQDAKGQIHQSAPTFPPLTVNYTSSSSRGDFQFRALGLTLRKSEYGRNDVSVVLYRTKKNGSTYYRVTPNTSPVLSDATARQFNAGYVTLTDTLSDADLGSHQLLYTVGGELENTISPAPSVVLAAKNRIFTVSGEDKSAVYYSKQIVPNQGLGFNDSLSLRVNPQFGEVTALGALDDKIVIFKATAIYVVAGDGPLPNGQQDTFSEPARLASDVGCANPSSVVETPLGLMFQSLKGIFLLDRSLQVRYVGNDVEGFNSYTVSGAFVLAYAHQVRMTTVEGTTLVYDYEQNTWTIRTNETAVGSVSWQNKAAFLRSNGQVAVETKGQVASDSQPVLSKIKTSFFSFASLQGFQRVWRILVLGKFVGNHVLKVTLFTDYKNTADDVFYIAVGDSAFVADPSVEAITTQSAVFTGTNADSQYQFSIKPRIQKCESLSVQIEDVFPTGVGTKAFNISNVSFEVGSKGVSKRLSATTTLVKG